MTPRCVFETRARVGESPLWVAEERGLYWLDHLEPAVHRFDPETGEDRTLPLELSVQAGGIARRAAGGFVIAKLDGLFFLDAECTRLTPFADPKAGRMDTCYNDGTVDRQGRLWIGTAHVPETDPEGCFYRVDADGTHAVIETGFVVPNGPAFSPDGRTLYFADTFGGKIVAFEVDPATGEAANRRPFASVAAEDGWPDGMTVDTEGFVWSAHWGGWRITRYDPDGKIERVIKFPVPQVSSCCFGGPDMRTLYVTTATESMTEAALAEAPLSGSLFAVDTPFQGLPEPGFAG